MEGFQEENVLVGDMTGRAHFSHWLPVSFIRLTKDCVVDKLSKGDLKWHFLDSMQVSECWLPEQSANQLHIEKYRTINFKCTQKSWG